jgi:phosphoserine phosphatase RsbU/P
MGARQCLQERFMQAPAAGLEALTYSAQCRQKRALGGDSFDFLPLPGRRVALAIADASGKGFAAALMIASAKFGTLAQVWPMIRKWR